MESAIKNEIGDEDPSVIKELKLDKYRLSSIDWNILYPFTSLEVLSLNGVGISSLENFPRLHSLKKLELGDNLISDGLNFLKNAELSNLLSLNLSGNKIAKMSELEPLSHLESLESLDLFGCAVTNTPDYQTIIFSLIPSLKALDRSDINFTRIHVDDSENTQEDMDYYNNRQKSKPPPQNGKLFSTKENPSQVDHKLYGNFILPIIKLDLDSVVSNIKSKVDSFPLKESLSSPPPPPLSNSSSPEKDDRAKQNMSALTSKLLQTDDESSEDDEDFNPDEKNETSSESDIEGGSESEENLSSGDDDDIPPKLKRTRTEDLDEDLKKQKLL